jgi:type VI protein secretion system component VasF
LQGIKIDQSSLQKSIQRQVERAIENQVGQIENLISEKDQQAKQHFAWAMMGFCLLLLLTIFYLPISSIQAKRQSQLKINTFNKLIRGKPCRPRSTNF